MSLVHSGPAGGAGLLVQCGVLLLLTFSVGVLILTSTVCIVCMAPLFKDINQNGDLVQGIQEEMVWCFGRFLSCSDI